MATNPELALTLDIVARAADLLEGPWWIIGSAAAFLVGLDERPADVDLLTGEADAYRLLEGWNVQPAPPRASSLFQSSVFATVRVTPLPVEVMANLRVRGELLEPKTRRQLLWQDRSLYLPDLAEQIAILELFGREKDRRRAQRLRAML